MRDRTGRREWNPLWHGLAYGLFFLVLTPAMCRLARMGR
jgi:hypothetical protein